MANFNSKIITLAIFWPRWYLQKYKGRVVLQGDNVKHDNGYNAVFIHGTKRISFLIGDSKISGYDWQTSQYGKRSQTRGIGIHASTRVGGYQVVEITRERKRTLGHHLVAHQNTGTQLRNQWFLLSETYTVTLRQACFGKEDWKKYF